MRVLESARLSTYYWASESSVTEPPEPPLAVRGGRGGDGRCWSGWSVDQVRGSASSLLLSVPPPSPEPSTGCSGGRLARAAAAAPTCEPLHFFLECLGLHVNQHRDWLALWFLPRTSVHRQAESDGWRIAFDPPRARRFSSPRQVQGSMVSSLKSVDRGPERVNYLSFM